MTRKGTASRRQRFIKVLDGRKQPIRGLWKRGECFYAQIQVQGKTTWPRLDARSRAEAVTELNRLRTKRLEGTLEVVTHAPKLADAIDLYKAGTEYEGKRPSTKVTESVGLKFWKEQLGQTRVNKITGPAIVTCRDKLAAGGRHPRTQNIYIGTLMQVLKFCKERGTIARLPEVSRLKQPKPPRRKLLRDAEFASLLTACRPGVTANSDIMHDFLRFLALTGAREKEALRVRWGDVNVDARRVTIGADGQTKNHETRDVDASNELIELIEDMRTRRAPDSEFLFPSPQRGMKDRHATNLRASLNMIRKEAGLDHVGFHDLRHLFISKCVMAGIPHMTIAEWVGHKDGGVLIGKVYGHLSQDHKAEMARKLSLFKKPEDGVEVPHSPQTEPRCS